MSYDDYVSKFLFLVTQLKDLDEKSRLTWFMDGLRDNTKFQLATRRDNIVSLKDAIQLASQFERLKNSHNSDKSSVDVNYVKHNSAPLRKKSNYVKKPNSVSNYLKKKSVSVPNTKNKPDSSKIVCYNCKKLGHLSKHCREPQKQSASVYYSEDKRCGIYPMLKSEATIAGNKMMVGFDSGASTSILSYEVALKYQIPFSDSNLSVRTVLGDKQKIRGMTDDLEVEVHGQKCKIAFMVLDHKENDALLGLDWSDKTDAGIFPKRKMIQKTDPSIQIEFW